MADDLDQLLRRTMKTLDDQVPSGYFDDLPTQTLARLETSMQQPTPGTSKQDQAAGAPLPVAAQPSEEDSGLHDIRNLAQSTKQRLTSKRSTTNPPTSDDDVLGTSSASWKNLALPQPAKMVSLPALEESPPKRKAPAPDGTHAPVAAVADVAAPAAIAPARSPAIEVRQPFSRPMPKRSKGPLLAVVGMGLAAAAGAVIFLQGSDKKPVSPTAATTPAAAVRVTPPPAPAAPANDQIAANEPDKVAEVQAVPVESTPAKKSTGSKPAAKHAGDSAKTVAVSSAVAEPKAPDAPAQKADKKPAGAEGEPSFDDLLKEAGVDKNKKEAKPKLEKKSLSGDDFKTGMAAIAGKAQGCYKGTQGTATIKLTVAPSGQVSKVSVGGQFANKPEAACVADAVKGASFPAWDGGPQSFNYSYLLSE